MTIRSRSVLFILFCVFLFGSPTAFASGSGVTYQGRILKPDGSPLSGATTQFKMQIRAPDAGNCLMYEEIQTLDLRNSNGSFSITMNDGTGARTDSTGLGLDRVFANRGTMTFDPATCSSGSSYLPNPSDGRNLVVLFKDETMAVWEPIPPQKINFVPFAFEAKQIAGFGADSLFRVVGASGDPLTGLAPLSNAQYTELLALANGTSTNYTKLGQLGGKALPTMNSGEVLGWNGTDWVSTTTMIQNGAVGTSQVAGDVSINTTGTLGAAITTTRDFKIYAASPSSFYVGMLADPTLAASYTLTWPLNAGSANQVLTTDGSGKLTWTTPSSAGITALTGEVTATGPGSAAATVVSVGGVTAANVASGATAANDATALNTPNTIVKRDGSGGFAAGAVSTTSVTSTGAVTQSSAVFKDSGSNTVTVQAPATVSPSYTLTLPTGPGVSGQVLKTDGSGNLGWVTPAGAGVTSVTSANTDIGVADTTTTPVLTLNSGTGANQILKLDGSSKIPAVDGSQITNLNAGSFTSGTLPVSRGGTGATNFANYSVITSNASGNQVAVPGSTSNTMLQWDVTGPKWSTAVWPSSTTANQFLYSSANNVVGQLATSNNGVLVTDGTGVPSIGSSLPSAVQGNITSVGTITSGTWNGTAIAANHGGTGQTAFTVGDLLYADTASTLAKLPAAANGYVLTSNGAGTAPSWQAATGGVDGSGAANYIPKFTAGTTLANSVLYETSGNVGIGTTSPLAPLHLNTATGTGMRISAASGGAQPLLRLENTVASNGVGSFITFDGPSTVPQSRITSVWEDYATGLASLAFSVRSGGATDERMRITGGGKVGIGTTSPAAALDVVGSSLLLGSSRSTSTLKGLDFLMPSYDTSKYNVAFMSFEAKSTTNTLMFGRGVTTGTLNGPTTITFNTSTDVSHPTSSAEAMRIDSAGNVGIGTTSPSAKLEVAGTVKFGTTGTAVSGMGTCAISSFAATSGLNAKLCVGVQAGSPIWCSPAANPSPTTVTWSAVSVSGNAVNIVLSANFTTNTTWTCAYMNP